jgi:photosystem II stability/assembly factor-like uncharacterized protein
MPTRRPQPSGGGYPFGRPMEEIEPAGLSPRALRGMALIALALLGMGIGVAAYLRSSAPHPYTGPPPPATSQPIPVSMDWRTAAQGWVVIHDAGGPESVVFRTTTGGARWERQFAINGPAFVRFTDASHGVLRANAAQAAGAQLLRTEDGGGHWRPVILPQLGPGTASTPFFLDRNRGWLLTARYSTEGQRPVVYGTADGGQSWRPLGSPGPATAPTDLLGDLAFAPGDAGWVFGTAAAGGAVLFETRDGGLTWTPQTLPLGAVGPRPTDRLDVAPPLVTATGEGVLSVYDRDGGQGWLYATGDGGATWSDPRPLPKATGSRQPVFVDAATGWTSDPSAAWLTADGGRTWRQTPGLPGGWQFSTVAPVSASQAWATAAQDGRDGPLGPVRWALFRTTDAGLHWTRAAMPDLA